MLTFAKLAKYSLALCLIAPAFAQSTQPLGISYNCQLQCIQGSASAINKVTTGWNNTQLQDLKGRNGTAPYHWSLVSGTLPTGLYLSPTTADPTITALNGYATATGTYTFSIKLTDSTPRSAKGPLSVTEQFTYTVDSITLLSQGMVGIVGQNYNDIYLYGGDPTQTYILVSQGTIPDGLFLSSNAFPGSALLSGAPTTATLPGQPDQFSVQVQLQTTDQQGNPVNTPVTGFIPFSVTVNALGLSFNALTAQVGATFSDGTGLGGSGLYSFALATNSGPLPPGLTIVSGQSAGPAINGTPTTPGTYSATIAITDAADSTLTSNQTVTFLIVPAAPLTITPPAIFSIGAASGGLTASGGVPPYNVVLTGDKLPDGVTATSPVDIGQNVLFGTPANGTAGTYNITAQVQDSTPKAAGGPLTGTLNFSLMVEGVTPIPNPSGGPYPVTNLGVIPAPGGFVGQAYSGIGTFLGTSPWTWQSVPASEIPPGLNENSTTGIQDKNGNPISTFLSGTPTVAGTWSFPTAVTDAAGLTGSQTFTLTIANANVYPDQSSGAGPWGLTIGPNGNLWFGESVADANTGNFQLGEISTQGTFGSFFQIPQVQGLSPQPYQLATAQDNKSLWVLLPDAELIEQVGSDGSVIYQSSTQLASQGSNPTVQAYYTTGGITTTGPKGTDNAWISLGVAFASPTTGGILKISSGSDHTQQFFALGNPNLFPQGIVWNEADGAFWFTASLPGVMNSTGTTSPVTAYVGRMLPDGTVQPPAGCPTDAANGVNACVITGANMGGYTSHLYSNIVLGPDGKTLWFTDPANSKVGSITVDGKSVQLYAVPSGFAPTSIVAGPDNALWFAEVNPVGAGSVGRLDPATGAITEFSPVSNPAGGLFNPQTLVTLGQSIWVTDSGSSQILQLTPPFTISCNFPNASVGVPVSGGGCNALGGTAPYTYSISNGSLPPGLSGPNASTGAISGTPTESGTYSFTVQAKDGAGEVAYEILNLKITVSKLTLTGCDFSAIGTQGVPYSNSSCKAGGGEPPYKFSVASGSLPAGLSLDANTGTLSGTPTIAGGYSFSVQLQDTGDANTLPQTQTYTSPTNPTLVIVLPKPTLQCTLPAGAKVGQPYGTSACIATGVGALTFSAQGLPPGLAQSFTDGSISGTPTKYGTYNIALSVTDSAGQVTVQSVSNFVVLPSALTVITSALPNGSVNLPYSANPAAAGGEPAYTWSIQSGALPSGLTLNAATGAITGTPSQNGTFAFALQGQDQAKTLSTPQAYSVSVSGPVKPNIIEYAIPLPTGALLPTGADSVVAGPDGDVWFTTPDQPSATPGQPSTGNYIGSLTTSGVFNTTYTAAAPLNASLGGGNLTVGANQNLWTAQTDGNAIGQATAAGVQSSVPITTANAGAQNIVSGPDGAIWFTENATNQIGRITTAGSITEYPIPTAQSGPLGITVGSDNAIWFTENATGKIGRIDATTGAITEIALHSATSGPKGIVSGPDGALWFAESNSNNIGRIPVTAHTATDVTEYAAPTAAGGLTAIVADPANGVLWFTEAQVSQIGRITTNGVITEYLTPTNPSGPIGITVGPDGAIWFAENLASSIAQFNFVAQLSASCSFLPGPIPAGGAYSGTCTASGGVAPYTYAVTNSGGAVPGVAIDPNTGVLSGTFTSAGTFTFTVTVSDSSTPAQTATVQSAPFTVSPLTITLGCSLPSGTVGSAYTGACTATFGTPAYKFSITNGALPAGLTLDPNSGAVTGIPVNPGTFSFTAQVTDAGSPQQAAVTTVTLVVAFGSTTSGGSGNPLFTLTGIPSSGTISPDQMFSNLSLTLNQSSPIPLSANLSFRFLPYGGMANNVNGDLASSYRDPAVQFLDASGNGAGTTYTVNIAPGTTAIPLPGIDAGTVAGTIAFSLSLNGIDQIDPNSHSNQLLVLPAVPVIEPNSVQITNVTATGFDVEFIAFSTTRQAVSATFTFAAASGTTLQGLNSFTVDLSQVTDTWFQSSSGLQYGGKFLLSMPFNLSGSINSIQSVTVTLANLSGSSAAVTGSK